MATLSQAHLPEMKERILACALDQYLKQGMHGFSLRHVADSLGVSATAIYRHYRNKEDLLQAIIDRAGSVLVEYLVPALSGADAEQRLRNTLAAYLDFSLQQGKCFEAAFLLPGPRDADPDSGSTHYLLRFLTDRVGECMEAGCLRKGDAAATAMSLWAVLQGQILLYLQGKCSTDEARFRQVFWDSHQRLLRGLLP